MNEEKTKNPIILVTNNDISNIVDFLKQFKREEIYNSSQSVNQFESIVKALDKNDKLTEKDLSNIKSFFKQFNESDLYNASQSINQFKSIENLNLNELGTKESLSSKTKEFSNKIEELKKLNINDITNLSFLKNFKQDFVQKNLVEEIDFLTSGIESKIVKDVNKISKEIDVLKYLLKESRNIDNQNILFNFLHKLKSVIGLNPKDLKNIDKDIISIKGNDNNKIEKILNSKEFKEYKNDLNNNGIIDRFEDDLNKNSISDKLEYFNENLKINTGKKIDTALLPITDFEKIGISKTKLFNKFSKEEFTELLKGNKTNMFALDLIDNDLKFKVDVKLSLKENPDKSFSLRVHPFRKEIENTYNLSSKELENLKLGKTVEKDFKMKGSDKTEKHIFQLDNEINEIVKLKSKDLDKKLDLNLSAEQKEAVSSGKTINIKSKDKNHIIKLDLNKSNGLNIDIKELSKDLKIDKVISKGLEI